MPWRRVVVNGVHVGACVCIEMRVVGTHLGLRYVGTFENAVDSGPCLFMILELGQQLLCELLLKGGNGPSERERNEHVNIVAIVDFYKKKYLRTRASEEGHDNSIKDLNVQIFAKV